LEPIGTPLDDHDLTAALDDMKNGVPASGTCVQLDERVGDQDLLRLVVCVGTRCKEDHQQGERTQPTGH
jgi:hypothetical protein